MANSRLNGKTISKKESRMAQIWKQYKKNKGAVIGLVVFILIVIIGIAANFIWDYETDIVALNASQVKLPPSWEHPFGTDWMGRDMLARTLYGTKYSLIIGIGATLISFLVGSMLGAFAGYAGGIVEDIIMRIVELLLMIPSILFTILIVYCLGTSITNLTIALGLTTVPHFARNARAAVMTVRDNEYVEAARALGAKDLSILFKHVIPNAMSPILVQATSRVAGVIIAAAGFSFLGLGVPSPLPEWGAMLSDARKYMLDFPYLVFIPGIAIMITTLSINLIGDGLRDALDPKLKR